SRASISSAAPDTSSWPPSWSRGRARLRSTRCDASTNAGPPQSTRSPSLGPSLLVAGRAGELPPALPRPVVLDLKQDVQEAHAFELRRERADHLIHLVSRNCQDHELRVLDRVSVR